jgi:hypothetical protein
VEKDGIKLWENSVVPYEFTTKVNSDDKEVVAKAIADIEADTCIRFKQRSGELAFIQISRDCGNSACNEGPSDCFMGSWVAGGLGENYPSQLFIGNQCLKGSTPSDVSLVIHELLHALGVVHTQTRPDRDDYITVNRSNIKHDFGALDQYKICPTCLTHDTPYDCSSVMHYRDYFFQRRLADGDDRDGGPTMTMNPQNPNTCELHNYILQLSSSDKELLNKMYSCKGVYVMNLIN